MQRCALLLACIMLVSGCFSEYNVTFHRVLSVDNDIVTTTDGEFVYENYNQDTKRLLNKADVSSLYLVTTGGTFDLKRLPMSTYVGTLYSLSNYIKYLKGNGFTELSFISNPNYIDVVLESSEYKLRTIYLSSGLIKILCVDSKGEAVVPPFL
ncbi:MAG: hypothetical protein LBS29_04500 [Endomicrobium sp.]|jgi:hypothetical protein|nr:hypothetical protein [Endomicrobium sp.]